MKQQQQQQQRQSCTVGNTSIETVSCNSSSTCSNDDDTEITMRTKEIDTCTKMTHTTNTKNDTTNMVWTLTTAWGVISIVACVAAIYYSTIQQQQQQQEQEQEQQDHVFSKNRFLFASINNNNNIYEEDVGDVPVAIQLHDHPQYHKPVYNEEHKALFPLNRSDYNGFFLAIVGLMIAAGGGVGGGGILVPIYILVMGFSPKHAIPLSNITVLGGSLANTLLNIRKRHPYADRPLVDWDLILVMEPFTVGGALIGAVLNKILPEVLLSILLVCLLSFTAYTSLKKAIKMFQKETRDIIAARSVSELTKLDHLQDTTNHSEAGNQLLSNTDETIQTEDTNNNDDRPTKVISIIKNDIDGHESLETLLKKQTLAKILKEERTTNPNNLIVLGVMFTVVLFVNIMKGGGAYTSPLGIQCGSIEFWLANIFLILWIISVAIFVRQYLVNRYHTKIQCNYPYVDGDIKWDEHTTIFYPCICMFAGFFAGMFGIGGGIVKGPLMLALGVHPAVSAASVAVMIFFTAFVAATSFIVFGLLIYDYAILLSLIGFVATLLGQVGLGYIMRKNNRNSFIVFSIGSVVALSAILMTVQSMISIAAGEKHHSGGICHTGD